MTLRELHERIAATQPAHWRLLPAGPGFGGGGATRAVAEEDEGEGDGSGAVQGDDAGARPGTPNASDAGHLHRAVLRADVDLVLTWGLRESPRDYFEPWLGNLGRMSEVRCDRILLDVLWRGSLVDRLLGLAFRDFLLPFPRSRTPRVKGLPDRFYARDETPAWKLAHELTFPDGVAFERVGHRSGLRVE
ncbi:hypothetical protein [Patulibacter americanus]|uniref:hypothetical protein n=1 Tax=Patulibacter americanus TaxID=588672 RepID=UPI0003B31A8A|nr:hypothetical protein [Patulibacter americanus]